MQINKIKYAFTNYSGGKDSHLSLILAKKLGYKIKILFSFNGGKIHYKIFNDFLKIEIIKKQSKMMGIELFEYRFSDYKIPFIDCVKNLLILKKIKANMTFISSFDYEFVDKKDHYIYNEIKKFLHNNKIKFKSFVNGKDTIEVIKESIKNNITSIITAVEKNVDVNWIGKEINERFIEYIKKEQKRGNIITANDFQTLVIKSPILNKKLIIDRYDIFEDKTNTTTSKLMIIKKYRFI